MKIPLHIDCSECGLEHYVFVNLKDTSFEWNCTCGADLSGFLSANVTTGFKLLYRSRYELMGNHDFSLSIVFSATAVDCELSRLHFKWRSIGGLSEGRSPTDAELEEQLRSFRSIAVKMEQVCRLMHPGGVVDFVQSDHQLKETVECGFPSLELSDLSKSFQMRLFWPRNRVLHLADATFSLDDAKRCFNIATLGLRILEALDQKKRACREG